MKIFFMSLCVFFFLSSNNSYSAQIRVDGVDPNSFLLIKFYGEIVPTDFEALKQVVGAYISSENNFRIIQLNSPGGDVETAMKIGRLLRRLEFDTQVADGSTCISSCVFIFSAGVIKSTTDSNMIGIHRPFGTFTGSLTLKDAKKNYEELKKRIYLYFEDMNIPRSLPEEMLRIPPEQIKMLSFDQAMQFGLNGKDPVAQERDDAANAKRYGISRPEYLLRRSNALKTCEAQPPNILDLECYEAIMTGERSREH